MFKKKFVKKTVTVSVSVALLFGHVSSVHASLKSVLNDMFMASTTQTQTFQTQRAFGVYGGNMTLRPVTKSIGIVQFAAPRISAGCGGIDMFFGSFSFINGEQFEQLLRSIAASAIGYAVKLAIQGMCNSCYAVMQNIEDTVSALNSLAKNTCSTSMSFFGDGPDKFKRLKESATNTAASIGAAAGEVADWFSSVDQLFSTKSSDLPANQDQSLRKSNPNSGNIVYRAAEYTLQNGANKWEAMFPRESLLEIIMGLFGTLVIDADVYNSSNQYSQVCNASVDASQCESMPKVYDPTIVSLNRLMYARKYAETDTVGVTAYKCGGQECTQLLPNEIPLTVWGGVEDVVNIALFGTVTPNEVAPGDYDERSIVGMILKNSKGENHSTLNAQGNFLIDYSLIPVHRMMLEVQHSPGAVITLAHALASVLPEYLAYQISMDMVNIAANVFSNQSDVAMPEVYKAYLEARTTELNSLRPDNTKMAEFMVTLTELIQKMQSLEGSYSRR